MSDYQASAEIKEVIQPFNQACRSRETSKYYRGPQGPGLDTRDQVATKREIRTSSQNN